MIYVLRGNLLFSLTLYIFKHELLPHLIEFPLSIIIASCSAYRDCDNDAQIFQSPVIMVSVTI